MRGITKYNVSEVNDAKDLEAYINYMASRGFSVFQIVPHTEPMIVITSKWVRDEVNVETKNYRLTVYSDGEGFLTPNSDDEFGIDMDPLWIPNIVDQIDNVLMEAHDEYS